jgi:hypothetical protein
MKRPKNVKRVVTIKQEKLDLIAQRKVEFMVNSQPFDMLELPGLIASAVNTFLSAYGYPTGAGEQSSSGGFEYGGFRWTVRDALVGPGRLRVEPVRSDESRRNLKASPWRELDGLDVLLASPWDPKASPVVVDLFIQLRPGTGMYPTEDRPIGTLADRDRPV